MQFTREHIAITWSEEGRAQVTLSQLMRSLVGEPVTLRFRAAGSRVGPGEPFGRAEGSHRTCNLYAPFALVIMATSPEHAEVQRAGEPAAELLDEAAYTSHFGALS